ncbi:tyrosine-type recombinase/integrase [Alcanivorax sp. DG881]|uniref:tyrosine-type recombinase/integrase n=1 Tax=Alcanivorax sp. DG881 TaxID=236097 RepID=UPI00017EBD9B|nr:tyrosine-type recombinase/integrase [Alcanivorax sp. DG881]EDX89863.1 site-specific recombinase, phage integrase family protein [Alcanivorax sp. DG881]
MKPTKSALRNLLKDVEEGNYQGEEFVGVDGTNLTIRIRGGVSGYIYKRIKIEGEQKSKPVKRKICSESEMRANGLDWAIEKADETIRDIVSGNEAQRKSGVHTLENVAQIMIDRGRPGRPYSSSYIRDVKNLLDTVLKPIANKPLVQVTRAEVERISIDYVKANIAAGKSRTGGRQVNTAMRVLSSVWNFGRSEFGRAAGYIENPVDVMSDKKLWYPETSRSRVLQTEEVGDWLQALFKRSELQSGSAVAQGSRDALLLFLFTGLRLNSLVSIPRDSIDLKVGVIEAPGKTDTTLPVTAQVKQIIEWRLKVLELTDPGGQWLFPTAKGKNGNHLLDPKKFRQAVNKEAGIDNLTTHDLRRTFKTIGAELGINADLLNRLTGHQIQGVNKHYIQSRVDAQRRQAQLIIDQVIADAAWDMQSKLNKTYGIPSGYTADTDSSGKAILIAKKG